MVTIAQVMTDEELQQAYRLRYQVYCVERGFGDAETFPDGCERDEWDPGSWHFLWRLDYGRPVGTVRLVHAVERALPLERHFDITASDFERIRPFAAEISRLAVARSVLGDDVGEVRSTGCGGGDESLALVSLIRSAYQNCLLEGFTHFLAVMERRLHILLRRHRIRFQPIGPTFEHRGWRRPYLFASNDSIRECWRRHLEVQLSRRQVAAPFPKAATEKSSMLVRGTFRG